MSQSQSEPPLENPADLAGSHDELTNQQLAVQARAAVDQALQLARLAEESARLARHLNEQVAVRAGHLISDHPAASTTIPVPSSPGLAAQAPTNAPLPTEAASPPIIANAVEPWMAVTRKLARGRRPVRKTDRKWSSVILSTALHLAVLALLGLLTIAIKSEPPIDTIMVSFADDEVLLNEEIPIEEPLEVEGEQPEEPIPQIPPMPPEEPVPEVPPEPMPVEIMEVAEAPAAPIPGPQPAEEPAVDLAQVGSRSEAGKALLLKRYGGTAASEAAVGRALDWFVSVQRKDGSWNFNDVGQASHAGTVNNPMGATSHVILAFLGAGHTHRDGAYKANVNRAINFLIKFGRNVPAGADFRGPNVEANHNFYVQGAAAMALCEAYMMTRDRRLRVPAQRAIDFIVAAQDPHGGGWRYEPFEAGCTSVTTLQLTALISAQRGGFKVPPKTLEGVRHFYETVQCDSGPTGRYCYRAAEPSYTSASTAQATLGRMYLGATRNDEDLLAAIELLDDRGPYDNRYYCYYATQALKNWGGDPWERWNQSMREELVRTQVVEEGPALGSWTPLQRGTTDLAGGRLFNTALSTMTLEVYYRYLPLYDSIENEDDSPDESAEVAADNRDETLPRQP